MVAGPGENAGVVRIGDGLAVAFKLESHNHPSAVEPYQGAATGVGGILRDIFTMGARPVAILDALKFGDPTQDRTRHLVRGVVAGVSGYGNCVGVPTVGGELVFHPSYQGNPLVNVMAVGVLEERFLTRAAAPGPGNLAVLFGSSTGRDGIGGASVLASATFGEGATTKRPSVQVGDPFAEKLLIEASLELIERGLVEGLQDLGAAGITCAVSETADRSGTGIRVDLDAIPRREPDMEPFEVMISESQERMLAIVTAAQLPDVLEVCRRWDLPAAVIGRVTDDGAISIVTGGLDDGGAPKPGARELARMPAAALTSEAIVHQRVGTAPTRRRPVSMTFEPPATDGLPERGMDPGAVLQALLGHPDLCSRAWVTRQYDATVGTDTVAGNEHGAAVIRVKGTTKGLVMATDAAERVGAHRPLAGGRARGRGVHPQRRGDRRPRPRCHQLPQLRFAGTSGGVLAAPGGRPRPGRRVPGARPAHHGRQREPVQRIGGFRRHRTHLPGGRGRAAGGHRPPGGAGAGGAGEIVAVLGTASPGMGGSVYVEIAGPGPDDRPPELDLAAHAALLRLLPAAAEAGLLRSAQDVSGGGLAVAIAEMCLWSGIGAELTLGVGADPARDLFGESPSRVVVTVAPA